MFGEKKKFKGKVCQFVNTYWKNVWFRFYKLNFVVVVVAIFIEFFSPFFLLNLNLIIAKTIRNNDNTKC